MNDRVREGDTTDRLVVNVYTDRVTGRGDTTDRLVVNVYTDRVTGRGIQLIGWW